MKADERLFCRCGIEVRVVRLGKSLLTLGHTRNPRQNHHPVRLAAPRSEQDTRVWDEDAVGPARTGAPLVEEAPRRGGGRSTGPDRTSRVPTATLRANSNPPLEARSARGGTPSSRHPRLQPSVGARPSGDG